MRRMRWLLCGLAIVGMAPQARAADLSDTFLRGSQTFQRRPSGARWEGFYAGGHMAELFDAVHRFRQRRSARWSASHCATASFRIRCRAGPPSARPKRPRVASAVSSATIGNGTKRYSVSKGITTRTRLLMASSDSLSRSILNNAAAPVGHDHIYNMTVSGNASVRRSPTIGDVARARRLGRGPFHAVRIRSALRSGAPTYHARRPSAGLSPTILRSPRP